MIQTNLDSIFIESNDSMVEKMSEKDFRLYMIKMIHDAKDELREQMQAMNDNTKKAFKRATSGSKRAFQQRDRDS